MDRLDSANLNRRLGTFGDRSSSWVTAYPAFQGYEVSSGEIRYISTRSSLIAAAEPLVPTAERASALQEFARYAKTQNNRLLILPISQPLAQSLTGYHAIPVGAEPVFDVHEYFTRDRDPLESFPSARSMRLKGFEVVRCEGGSLSPSDQNQVRFLYEEWMKDKRKLGFLSEVNPFHELHAKTFFLLKRKDKIEGYVTALPVKPLNAMYFADWIRPQPCRPGMMEYLIVEAMRILWKDDVREVRLGMAPLARLEAKDFSGLRGKIIYSLLQGAFRWLSFPYSFQGLYEFKSKLKPTRWEKCFAATPGRMGVKTVLDLFEGATHRTLQQTFWENIRTHYFVKGSQTRAVPKNFRELAKSTQITWMGVAIMVALHALSWRPVDGFSLANFTWTGFSMGPLFHDHLQHLIGDLSTFLFFGGLVEIFLGKKWMMILTTLGFWATNPIAVGILFPILPTGAWQVLTFEKDFGSSNAIYAYAGALAALVPQARWVLVPFILNGLAVCFGKWSVLAIHHWVGLAIGYFLITRVRSGLSDKK